MQRLTYLALLIFCIAGDGVALENKKYRNVMDSRGVSVMVPAKINRVVTISDGLVEGVMTVLGVQKTIVGVGSHCLQNTFNLSWKGKNGITFSRKGGAIPVSFLNPNLMKLPRIASATTAPNYEEIATLKPDVMIIRVGSCWHWQDDDQVPASINLIESLGIPVIVLHSPKTFDSPAVSHLLEEIRIIGRVFGNEQGALKLASFLRDQVDFVRKRTRGRRPE